MHDMDKVKIPTLTSESPCEFLCDCQCIRKGMQELWKDMRWAAIKPLDLEENFLFMCFRIGFLNETILHAGVWLLKPLERQTKCYSTVYTLQQLEVRVASCVPKRWPIGPYPKPVQCSLQTRARSFCKIRYIVFPSTPRFPTWPLPLECTN
jgi:hypothetical protein